jgi:protein-S-isoprenylcysteine O-methyltransferase Ste14
MGIHLTPVSALLAAAGLLGVAVWVFRLVRRDYAVRGSLSRGVAWLQTGYFCLYALTSYIFLDARLSAISPRGIVFSLAVVLSLTGLVIVLLSMPFLGRRSFGADVGELRTTGLYRYSRNPQLVGGFLLVVGYALLWPTWIGLLWAGLWIPIAHLMVAGEEEHLRTVFGAAYEAYCRRTPRYLGWRAGKS